MDEAGWLSHDDSFNGKLKRFLYLMQRGVKIFSAMFGEIRVGTSTLGLLIPQAE